jgi:nicotinate-nucleotide--dimethylbenzimidazole phosphoribosyltransferase
MPARDVIADAIASMRPPCEASRDAARELQAALTKPAGALGRLEELHIWAAGVFRDSAPAAPRKTIIVAAGDHGVAAGGSAASSGAASSVSAYPQSVTAQMVRNFLDGGAAVNALAAHAGADVRVVDAGIMTDIDDARRNVAALHVAKLRRGCDDISRGPAMPRDEAEELVARGILFARDEASAAPCAIGLGDMGIGNTTAAAAITSAMTGAPVRLTAGRGTGIDDAAFAAKVDAIERALIVNEQRAGDALDVLAKVGGCEIAFLTGVAIGVAASGAAIVLDGYPTTAAAMIAAAIAPYAAAYMVASHVSAEPGHRIALDHLGMQPLLDLQMRLGEGTGAALAMTLLDAALRIPRETATFSSAGVSRSVSETRPEL